MQNTKYERMASLYITLKHKYYTEEVQLIFCDDGKFHRFLCEKLKHDIYPSFI